MGLSFSKLAAVLLPVLFAQGLFAQEVVFDVPEQSEGFVQRLKQSSLTFEHSKRPQTTPQDLVATAQADYKRLVNVLYAQGYYAGAVSIKLDGIEAASIDPFSQIDHIEKIVFFVEAGVLYQFGDVSLGPKPPAVVARGVFDEVRDVLSFPQIKQDKPARLNLLKNAGGRLLEEWRFQGHAKARLSEKNIQANHKTQRLNAQILIDPGPVLQFGVVDVSGHKDVLKQNILKISGLPEGDIYSPKMLESAKQRLRTSGAFNSVAILEAEEATRQGRLPLTIRVSERQPRRFGGGLEFSTVQGPILSGFWLHRNAFGGAEQFRVEGTLSGFGASKLSGSNGGADYSVGVSLRQPAIWGAQTDLNSSLSFEHVDEQLYKLDKVSVQTSLKRQIRDDLSAEIGVRLEASDERTSLGDRKYLLLGVPISATLDRRDEPGNAKEGYYLNIKGQPFVDLQGESQGFRVEGDLRGYKSFDLGKPVTFAGRLGLGGVVTGESLSVPAEFRFYSGGGDSVRGHDYRSLGVTNAIGSTSVQTGGLARMSAQLEARILASQSIEAVGFFDVGTVSAGANPFRHDAWHSGVGVGLRYLTGIGPIRVDVAAPSHGESAFKSLDFYIGIGQAF